MRKDPRVLAVAPLQALVAPIKPLTLSARRVAHVSHTIMMRPSLLEQEDAAVVRGYYSEMKVVVVGRSRTAGMRKVSTLPYAPRLCLLS
jgi:hypothetical protein